MGQRICITMPYQSFLIWNFHPAKHQLPAFCQPVNIR